MRSQGCAEQSVRPDHSLPTTDYCGSEPQQRDFHSSQKVLGRGSNSDSRCSQAGLHLGHKRPRCGRCPDRAMDIAEGDIWLFLDDDVILEADFLKELIAVYSSYPEVTGVSGVVTNYHPPPWQYRLWDLIFARGPFHDERQSIYWKADTLRGASPIAVSKFGAGLMSFRAQAVKGVRFDGNLRGSGWRGCGFLYASATWRAASDRATCPSRAQQKLHCPISAAPPTDGPTVGALSVQEKLEQRYQQLSLLLMAQRRVCRHGNSSERAPALARALARVRGGGSRRSANSPMTALPQSPAMLSLRARSLSS